ncbi:PP0621 family protein [Ramlibacter montanisoli]|uniref:Uncharacterized protein n=1 Tax=Ramlibacter montanisoli TaxID=2732512 RepID=A0A849KIV4_9BURK|nr:PP0621 family protein [Ramlibacter montanisoli]NNU44491.1 hypothetical protein [Ramlibacter montanisoli]
MKYLVLLAVLVIAYMVWRNARLERKDDARRPPAPGTPQEMVSCPVCGLHLPKPDAVRGADGLFYCSQEHRLTAGG